MLARLVCHLGHVLQKTSQPGLLQSSVGPQDPCNIKALPLSESPSTEGLFSQLQSAVCCVCTDRLHPDWHVYQVRCAVQTLSPLLFFPITIVGQCHKSPPCEDSACLKAVHMTHQSTTCKPSYACHLSHCMSLWQLWLAGSLSTVRTVSRPAWPYSPHIPQANNLAAGCRWQ